jgi:hypothetical protein
MLIDFNLCLWIGLILAFASVFSWFFIKESASIIWLIICLASFWGLITFCTVCVWLPDVYIVNEMDHKHKYIIGSLFTKLNNGDTVKVKGNCVVNNSTKTIYVESLHYSPYTNFYETHKNPPVVEDLAPYTVYSGHIDYVFETPPRAIHQKKKESTVKKWLHY